MTQNKYFDYTSLSKALYILNKHAKDKRDQKNWARYCEKDDSLCEGENEGISSYKAQTHLDRLYDLKDCVIQKLISSRSVKNLGYHKTWNSYYGTFYFICYSFCGKSFHVPSSREDALKYKPLKKMGEVGAEVNIEKGGKMPPCQAIKICLTFLKNV